MTVVALFVHRIARPLEQLTGIGRYAVELSRALVARGSHEYVLVAPFDDDPAPGVWPDMPIIRIGGDRRVLQAAWRVAGRPRLDRMVRSIDLVHAVSPTVPVPTAAIPLVATIHDLFPFDQPAWKSRRGRWLFRGAIEHTGRHASQVITPSRHVADQVADRVGVSSDRLVVIPEGVDDRFHAASADDGTLAASLGLPADGYLLALGSVSTRKNLGVVVDALGRLPVEARPVLAIAGPDGDAAAALSQRVARLGLEDWVVRTGFVPDDDVPTLLAGAVALVHPSRDEGFGLPVAEALAAGVPVIASRAGALPELVGDAGRLLPPEDPAAWAAAIGQLDRADRADVARRGRARAAGWRWSAAAAATESVYARALADGRGASRR